jgi:hypothetical protein
MLLISSDTALPAPPFEPLVEDALPPLPPKGETGEFVRLPPRPLPVVLDVPALSEGAEEGESTDLSRL